MRALGVLSFAIFAVTTAEFSVIGLMPALQGALSARTSQLGLMVSSYATGMVVGGPVLSLLLIRNRMGLRRAVTTLLLLYSVVQFLTAFVDVFTVFCGMRCLAGAIGSAVFGACLSTSAGLVPPDERGRAASIVLGGLTLGTTMGLPLCSALGTSLSWRVVITGVSVLTLVGTLLVRLTVPATVGSAQLDLRDELAPLTHAPLWWALGTSALTSSAVFSVFSYLIPFLIGPVGLGRDAASAVLLLYGAATVLGTVLVGSISDRAPLPIAIVGNLLLASGFGALWLGPARVLPVVALVLVFGLSGVSLNPAFAVRVMAISGPKFLVNTLHSSVINLGILAGSATASLSVAMAGQRLHQVFLVGCGFALAAAASVFPALGMRSWQQPIPASEIR